VTKPNRYSAENLIIWACVAFGILAILWILTSCSAMRQAVTTVEYTKGCHIAVMSASQDKARVMLKDISFDDCSAGAQEADGDIKVPQNP
jgi:hypothetical protein